MNDLLSMLLGGAVEVLDISPHTRRLAVAEYGEAGTWLAENGSPGCIIYPQGSFRLGTVVQPNTPSGAYDIDLVCLLPLDKTSISQTELKERVGRQLQAYVRSRKLQANGGPTTCEPSRRAWTLSGYPDHNFHLDVLPAIPDPEPPRHGIQLTDKQLRHWQHSNPIGYVTWFEGRTALGVLNRIEAKGHHNVAEMPPWGTHTTLQRVIQVLKWHTMVHFENDLDNRPPSILVTTLAARAYTGEQDLFMAARSALAGMLQHIENRNGRRWIPNPAHPNENFADKWNDYPEREKAFMSWHDEISALLNELGQMENKGIDALTARMSQGFSEKAVQASARRYAERQQEQVASRKLRMSRTGLLTPAATGPLVPRHTFHGQHTDPRG